MHWEFPPTLLGTVNWNDASLEGAQLHQSCKIMGDLQSCFLDHAQARRFPPETVVYRVQWFTPVAQGTEGGLFWGNTVIEPGRVGDEYFMTHGHFHQRRDRSELYATVAGSGMLVLMDESRRTWVERMEPGTLHYIPGNLAHRVVNVGASQLRFLAAWPSDAGHDYASIAEHGFGARVLCCNGQPALVGSEK